MTHQLRRAEQRDAEAVFALVERFATSYRPEADAFAETFAAVLDEPTHLVLVAAEQVGSDEAPRVLGYLLADLHPTFFANAPVAWVEEVMVDDGARRTGVGGELMAAAEEWAAARGAAYLALATRRAAEFYLALGYEESATFFRKIL